MQSLKARLDVLRDTNTITERASLIAERTVEQFVTDENADSYTMLITHLAMAVTRIDRLEPLSPPPESIMKEIYESRDLEEAKRRVAWIEETMGDTLPQEEKEFLIMHFVSALSMN
ncbi:PRD domain-containing protein [Halalkalibacterium halodurans]|uniref:BH0587 protein n=2 Tax=Halalkalibacterium halodurans TaxID=86665 RepID=Q9KF98_HALH5|nr:PRD domain-containing protein [Halalkalibacterium halodurans]MDY7221080.1 PRD domain-containing protein [Halalkalibacterium halodurans]MDY7240319.1 PRD domain-containing protein [Halalkalibacterium halodurans]MED3645599.1 PRD domain-containing protein [Halalkalibacterium halodurans]MED4124554.1 PRD domain-containing protein [Halalkalibacterium halodurans]MED4161541.1 PRD domain-containing protein [Halalkalibacterium halodurans]